MATIDGIGRAWWVAVAGKMVRCLAAGGSRIRTRGPTTKRKAMGNHSRQVSPPRTWTCKWLRLSCRRLQLATPRRAFRRSGTDGSTPAPSSAESITNLTFGGSSAAGGDVSGTKGRRIERRCCAEGQPLIFHSPLGVRHQVRR